MEEKVDVRISKTKERLKKGLLRLIKEKKLENISISDLCKVAEINRNTFYSHYRSVSDVVEEIEENFLVTLSNNVSINQNVTKNVTDLLYSVLVIVEENKEMISVLLSPNGNKEFLNSLVMVAFPSAVENWSKELHMTKDKAEILYYFIQGGIVNVIKFWVQEDFKTPPKELAENLNRMVLRGQSAFVFSDNL